MAGQTEMALADDEGQRKTTKTKKKRSTGTKKSSTGSTRKKSASPRRTKQAESGGLPIMKLRAIDIVDGTGTKAAGPDKAKDQDNEEPQVIHMPPPGANEVAGSEDPVNQSVSSGLAENENPANENQVSDPELLELLEQLSVTIDTANTVLDAAANVPSDGSQPQPQLQDEQTYPQPDGTLQMQQQQRPEYNIDRLADRLNGLDQEKDDLRPLAERFASTPDAGDAGRKKRGRFGLVANAALTGLIVAAGVGWLAYTNPWILESSEEPQPAAPQAKQTAALSPQEPAAAPVEDAKDQAQLGDARTASPDTGTGTQAPAVVPAPAKPKLSALTPPKNDPAPSQQAAIPPAEIPVFKPVRGKAGTQIALNVGLPADAGSAEMSIMVQSVPSNTQLSAGKDLGSGNWLLTTGQLEGLTLNTERDLPPGEYQVEVIMVRSDGKVPQARKVAVLVDAPEPVAKKIVPPAPAKEIVAPKPADAKPTAVVRKPEAAAPVVAPPAPPVAATPTLPPLSAKEVQNILKRGDALLREGDVAGARLLLGYAATRGHKEAMVILAKSYDPEYLGKLGVRGVEPDADKAAHWYERARQAQ